MKKVLICLGLGLVLTSCWAKEPACAIIKTAADVCTMVEYQGEDGKTYRVKLTKEQVEQMARDQAAKDGLPPPRREAPKEAPDGD